MHATQEAALSVRNLQFAITHLVLYFPRVLAIDCAAYGKRRAEHLHHDGLHVGPHGVGRRLLCNLKNLREGDIAAVLDVLHLLAVTRRLLQGADQTRGNGGRDTHSGHTVLDAQLTCDLETLPVLRGLGDVLADLLGIQAERTDLRSERRCGRHFTTDGPHNDYKLLVGVKLGGHFATSFLPANVEYRYWKRAGKTKGKKQKKWWRGCHVSHNTL
ncbi:hypothetical protein ECC02_001443 [Trypanosoma cruzi]|uniref:Uncharacterized protein n=1 Tax=Trypanosoma cruzi TaxID=5693 RepID=A0A7J6YGG3_TRYCR|nr:hypothetical protein ECC02_001443 [Trypanosoma cruzi]